MITDVRVTWPLSPSIGVTHQELTWRLNSAVISRVTLTSDVTTRTLSQDFENIGQLLPGDIVEASIKALSMGAESQPVSVAIMVPGAKPLPPGGLLIELVETDVEVDPQPIPEDEEIEDGT